MNNTEITLQYSWNSIAKETRLNTIHGDEVIVYFPGIWNFEEGPDFKSAKVSIDGEIITGDIEIHRCSTDWISHGHHNDKRYDNVILHIVQDFKNNDFSDIPTIVLSDRFIQELPSKTSGHKKLQKYPHGYCASQLSGLSDNILSDFFTQTGKKRFFEKTAKFTKKILKNGAESAFLEHIFDSCGYKKNRPEFAELFKRITCYDLASLTDKEIVAILWGESGLLPDPGSTDLTSAMKSFIDQNWQIWWKLRKEAKEGIKWRLSGVRPLNNPCRRVAAVSVLVSRCGINLFRFVFHEFNSVAIPSLWKTFKELLICKDKLWDSYSTPYSKLTRKAAVLGEMRALDIMTNVILPFIYAYADINSMEEIKNKALGAWKNLPPGQQNIILKISSHRWLIPHERAISVFNSSAAQQGAIHVHKTFCESTQMNCSKCPVFKNLKQKSP